MTFCNSCISVNVGIALSEPFDTGRGFRQGDSLLSDLFVMESILRKAGNIAALDESSVLRRILFVYNSYVNILIPDFLQQQRKSHLPSLHIFMHKCNVFMLPKAHLTFPRYLEMLQSITRLHRANTTFRCISAFFPLMTLSSTFHT